MAEKKPLKAAKKPYKKPVVRSEKVDSASLKLTVCDGTGHAGTKALGACGTAVS